ncbi:MAG: alpha/beta hydrolase [Caldicoprobacterales bacterium]|nr:alpha/beta hydrolase [Clostridiales bacterium]
MKIVRHNLSPDGRVYLTGYIQEPSKELKDVANKPAVLVLPGGAYIFTSDREAEPIALAYSAKGFQTFVLRYSVGKYANGCKPLKEASEAIRIIRENAQEWNVIPDKIAVCGFSAGGHLSAWVGLKGEHRPNAMILAYPALELVINAEEHDKLIQALLGKNYTKEEAEKLNLYRYVDEKAIPMFCWHTVEDKLVDVKGLIRFVSKYAEYGRPFECHIFQQGEHGLSLALPITANENPDMVDYHAAKWFEMSVEWLYRTFTG